MDAKQFLQQYAEFESVARIRLKEYKAESEMLKELMPYMKHEADFVSLVRFAKKVKARADEASKERDNILATLNSIPGLEWDILHARYIEQMKWEDMATKFSYSWQGVFKAHDRALRMLQSMIDEKENPLQT